MVSKMNSKKKILFVIFAGLLIVVLVIVGIFVVISKDNNNSEKNEDDEIVYYLDRYSDTYASFKVKVKENEDTYTVTLMAGDEVIFTEDVIYDAENNQIIAENDIIFDKIELTDDSEVVYFGEATGDTKFVTFDEYKADDVNYGKVISFEKTENEDEYKISYGSSENEVEESGSEEGTTEDSSSTEVSTEEMTTEKEATEEDTTTEAVNTNGSSGNSGNSSGNSGNSGNSSTGNGGNNSSQQSGNSGGNSGSGNGSANNSGSSGNSNSGSGSNSNGNGSSSNTTTPPATTEAPSTEAPETPTTEEVHQHSWEEVWGEKTMQTGSIGECVYCKYQSNDDIADHCTLCGGIWTHEELVNADPFIYNACIGRPKGSNWRYVPVYETVKTILYYKCECGAVKYSE